MCVTFGKSCSVGSAPGVGEEVVAHRQAEDQDRRDAEAAEVKAYDQGER
jgi:hypothetical protein